MAPRRQTGVLGDRSAAPAALVAAAKTSLADWFPSAITGRSLAKSAGVNYGQLHRHFESKTALLAAAFDELLREYAEHGTDEAGVPRPFGFRDNPQFWRALVHLMLDRTTFDEIRPSQGVLTRAVLGVQRRRPELDADQAKSVVALGVSIDLGLVAHRGVLGRAAGLDPNEPAVDVLARQWLEGLFDGNGPLGAAPVAWSHPPYSRPLGNDPLATAPVPEAADVPAEAPAENRLVRAGALLLEGNAPSAITGRQLARTAGVNYGLIHHYFGTKDEVLRHSVQFHRDQFFAANAAEHRAPGYFSVCEYPGYVRATTWAAIHHELAVAEQRFPVIDVLLQQRLTSAADHREELASRVAVLTVVSAQLAWALFGDLFERSLDAELARLESLVAPLLHRLLQAPLHGTEFTP